MSFPINKDNSHGIACQFKAKASKLIYVLIPKNCWYEGNEIVDSPYVRALVMNISPTVIFYFYKTRFPNFYFRMITKSFTLQYLDWVFIPVSQFSLKPVSVLREGCSTSPKPHGTACLCCAKKSWQIY